VCPPKSYARKRILSKRISVDKEEKKSKSESKKCTNRRVSVIRRVRRVPENSDKRIRKEKG